MVEFTQTKYIIVTTKKGSSQNDYDNRGKGSSTSTWLSKSQKVIYNFFKNISFTHRQRFDKLSLW